MSSLGASPPTAVTPRSQCINLKRTQPTKEQTNHQQPASEQASELVGVSQSIRRASALPLVCSQNKPTTYSCERTLGQTATVTAHSHEAVCLSVRRRCRWLVGWLVRLLIDSFISIVGGEF